MLNYQRVSFFVLGSSYARLVTRLCPSEEQSGSRSCRSFAMTSCGCLSGCLATPEVLWIDSQRIHGAGRNMLNYANKIGIFLDGIHGTPYIAAPWIRHGFGMFL